MVLVFYLSGHGLGHATRQLEVIGAAVRQAPGARVIVRTSAPRWIFEAAANPSIEWQEAEVDTGVTQIDSLRLDEDDTARRAARFYRSFADRIEAEAALLRSVGAAMVVGDIPPLAHAAAARAGVGSIAVGNFTWDWIYEAYPSFGRHAPGAIALIRDAYASATLALRLPFHGGFVPMSSVVRDVPLIARRATRGRGETRRALGVDETAIVVLASFGGYGARLPYDRIAQSTRFSLLLTNHEAAARSMEPGRRGRFHCADMTALAARGFRYADLVAASDVVVSKPGYGIVSECIANGAALLYTSRGRFREQDVFLAEMPTVLRCRFISQEDLSESWDNAVDALLAQDPPVEHLATDGATVAARTILETA
jgi:L-arabinokinase